MKNMNIYLQRALELAQKADSRVFPNPRVGAVLVHKDRIIGEGLHEYAGGPHAEVNAVNNVQNPALIAAATLYVSLEPCNHFGKTPPCTDLILAQKIKKVVVGCLDPNPKVAGMGVKKLRENGVEVTVYEHPQVFQELNKIFFVNQLEKRAYIVLKWAESKDGFISPLPAQAFPITGREAQYFVHRLRSEHHAIMVGTNTALIDNPALSNRYFYGQSPIRIVWDKNLRLPLFLQLFTDKNPTIILNNQKDTQEESLRFFQPKNTDAWHDMHILCQELYQELGICSILVEGGTNLLQQFIAAKCYDEVYQLVGNTYLGEGIAAPTFTEIPTEQAFL
jgi:diaminohydroxyphosphoribosylaminopyrimidine deaminase / 5-amino-6-(5-phosphoribosylamino)uracil reductase